MAWTLRKRVVAAAAGAAAFAAMPAALVIGTAAPAVAQTVVSTEAELRTAFANDPSISLANDITLEDCDAGDVDRDGPNAAVTLDGQGHTIRQTCPDERVLDVGDGSPLTLRRAIITGGKEDSGGGGVEVFTGSLNVIDSTFTGNCTNSSGGAIRSNGAADVTVNRSTLADNLAANGGGAVNIDETGDLRIVNSTITQNTSGSDGALDTDSQDDDVITVYSTIVQNVFDPDAFCEFSAAVAAEPDEVEAPEEVSAQQNGDVANITSAQGYFSFGTVVALPIGGVNCESNDAPTSSGFNFSDDDTCQFTNTAEGDRESAGDPGLGALANNGGPTQTRLPQPGSPLINFIPIPDCGGGDDLAGFAVTTDQRGVTRPQETGCEIGSVEIEAPPEPVPPAVVPTAVPVEPRFTG